MVWVSKDRDSKPKLVAEIMTGIRRPSIGVVVLEIPIFASLTPQNIFSFGQY